MLKDKLLLLIVLLILGNNVVWADQFDEGVAAYSRQDYKTAFKAWMTSAQQGNARAQLGLGVMYDKGQGVPQDYVEGDKWIRLAAQNGQDSAQLIVGAMYSVGQGVPQDYVKAYLWFNLAAVSGDADSIKFRDQMASKMIPSQILESHKMARDCVANKLKGCD